MGQKGSGAKRKLLGGEDSIGSGQAKGVIPVARETGRSRRQEPNSVPRKRTKLRVDPSSEKGTPGTGYQDG